MIGLTYLSCLSLTGVCNAKLLNGSETYGTEGRESFSKWYTFPLFISPATAPLTRSVSVMNLRPTCDGEGDCVRGGPSPIGLVRLKPEVVLSRVSQPNSLDLDRTAGVAPPYVAGDPGEIVLRIQLIVNDSFRNVPVLSVLCLTLTLLFLGVCPHTLIFCS